MGAWMCRIGKVRQSRVLRMGWSAVGMSGWCGVVFYLVDIWVVVFGFVCFGKVMGCDA